MSKDLLAIHIGDLAYGINIDPTRFSRPATGVVKNVLIHAELNRWVAPESATDAQLKDSVRRYEVLCADGRKRTIDGALRMSSEPLAWLVASYRAAPVGDPGRRPLRQAVLSAARRGLDPTGRRGVAIKDLELEVLAVAGGGLTRVNVRRVTASGESELLLAQSGTWGNDREALRSFSMSINIAIDL